MELRSRVLQLTVAVQHAAVLDLTDAVLGGGAVCIDLRLRIGDLLQRRVALGFKFGHGALVLLQTIAVLGFGAAQLALVGADLGLAIGNLLLRVLQLGVRVVELGVGVGLLLLVVRVFLVQLRLRVVDLLLRVVHQAAVAQVGPRLGLRLQTILKVGQRGVVLVGIDLARSVDVHEDLGEVVQIEAPVGQVDEARQAAGADAGVAALIVQVVGGIGDAHQGVAAVAELLQRVRVVGLGEQNLAADVLLGEEARVAHHLVVGLRHAPGDQAQAVHLFRQGVGAQRAVVAVRAGEEEVRPHRALGAVHALQGSKIVLILRSKAERGNQAVVEQVVFPHVGVPGAHHCGAADAQAAEEAHAQRDDRQYGEIAAPVLFDGPERGFFQRLHYHSISSTGTARSLTRSESTVPLLSSITRSAMAVRAELWVMMMTVMPLLRAVSCKSFRMALPVL